jgi:hypothetical protein
MKEKTLFTLIALLLVLILGVAAYAAFRNPSAVTSLPSTAASTVTSAVGISGDGAASPDTTSSGTVTNTTTSGTSGTTGTTGSSGSTSTQAPGTYTMAQIAAHNSASSCYTAINGSAYDLTPFIGQHPGGSVILSLCGIDGTAGFEAQHGGQRRPESELASLKIGTIVK